LQWQPQLSKKRDFLPILFPRELLHHKDEVLPTSKGMKMAIGERASELKEREEEKDLPKTREESWE